MMLQRTSVTTQNRVPIRTGRIAQFEAICPSADRRGDVWQEWYELARVYFTVYGNLLVPRDYTTRGKKLGRWIERQRALYNGKIACGITSDHVITLDQIGMVWKLEDRMPWNEWYVLAKRYHNSVGSLCIPKDCVFEGKALGAWIGEQRKRYKGGKLSQKQIHDLEKIEMIWQAAPARIPWESTYQEAKAYYAEHGNLRMPMDYRSQSGTNLWRWICMQRDIYHGTRHGSLTKDQINSLTEIGMVWAVYDEAWEAMYAVAAKYYEQHGDLLVKQAYKTENGERLGQWISQQRRNYQKKPLSNTQWERIDRLNQIGMVWCAERKCG